MSLAWPGNLTIFTVRSLSIRSVGFGSIATLVSSKAAVINLRFGPHSGSRT